MKVKHNGCPNNDWALLWTHHLLRSPALHSDSNPMVLKHLKIKSEVNTHRGRWKTTVLSKSGVCLTYSLLANLVWQGAGSSSKSASLSPWLEKCHWNRCKFPYFPWSFCGPHWFYVRSPESHWGHIPPCVSWLPPRWDHHAHLRGDEIGRLRHIETHAYHIGNPVCAEYPIPQSSCPTLWDRPNTSPPTFPKASFCTSSASAKPTSWPPASGSCILAMTTNTGDQCSRKNKDHHESWSSSRIKCKRL